MEAATRISVIASRNISPSHARTVMSRLGFKCLKPGSAPGKANVAEQLDFFEESLRPRLEEAKAGKQFSSWMSLTSFEGLILEESGVWADCGYTPPRGKAGSM